MMPVRKSNVTNLKSALWGLLERILRRMPFVGYSMKHVLCLVS
jgi:hypothetical protein